MSQKALKTNSGTISRREFLRLAALGGASVFGAGAIAACTPGQTVSGTATAAPQPTQKKVVLRFLQGFQPGEGEYPFFKWTVDEYNKIQSAVEVQMMDTPRTEIGTVMRTMAARGEPPDFVVGGPIDATVARSGVLRSLESYYTQPIGYGKDPGKPWNEVFNQALVQMQKVDGTDFGVPGQGAYTFVIYYNTDVFDKYKVTVPKTWNELIQAAETFKSAQIAPFALAGVWPYYMQWWFFTLAQRIAGLDPLLAAMYLDKEASWNQPEFLAAAEEIQKLRDSQYFADGFQGMDNIAAHMEFISGRAAMDFVGTWFPGEMKQSLPADFPLASFAFPAFEGGKGDQTCAQLWANNYTVMSTQHIPESMDFMKWVSSSDVQDKQVELLGTISTRSDSPCPAVQAGGCDQVASAQSVSGYEFDIFSHEPKLEARYQTAAVDFFFGKTDAQGYIDALSKEKEEYFAAQG